MVLIGTATAEVNPFTRIAFIQKASPTEVQAAIDAGWDVNEIDPRFGKTALINSIRVKRLDITRLLIEADADLDYHPPRKTSFPAALLLASYKGNVEAARLLLDAGADIEIRTETSGYTPLLYAAMNYHTDVVQVLLDHGADPTVRTYKDAPRYERKYRRANMSARDFAVKYKFRDMVDLIDAALFAWNGQPKRGCLHVEDKRFSDLAVRHFGDRERWREIWELNDMKKGQSIRTGDCFLLPEK